MARRDWTHEELTGARRTLRLRDVTRSVSEGVRTAAINCCACRREVTRSVSKGVRTTNLQFDL